MDSHFAVRFLEFFFVCLFVFSLIIWSDKIQNTQVEYIVHMHTLPYGNNCKWENAKNGSDSLANGYIRIFPVCIQWAKFSVNHGLVLTIDNHSDAVSSAEFITYETYWNRLLHLKIAINKMQCLVARLFATMKIKRSEASCDFFFSFSPIQYS